MTTDKQEAEIVATARDRYADSLQAAAYASIAGMNDVYDWYCIEHCLSDDDAEDAYTLFQMEFASGIHAAAGEMRKTISDLAWKRAQAEPDTEWLKNEFFYSHKYQP